MGSGCLFPRKRILQAEEILRAKHQEVEVLKSQHVRRFYPTAEAVFFKKGETWQ